MHDFADAGMQHKSILCAVLSVSYPDNLHIFTQKYRLIYVLCFLLEILLHIF
jgi:hypothetical protein